MAINEFIPAVWSENLQMKLSKQYIAISNCTREYEGEIKERGNVVKIGRIGPINLRDYTKNMNMADPEELTDSVRSLTIDQAKYFNFLIDDIDRAQASSHLMDLSMKGAADALASAADKYVYGLYEEAGKIITQDAVDENTIINLLLKARTELLKNNIYDPADIVIEVTPEIAELILRAKVNLINNAETLETGCMGSIAGSKIFVSNNITKKSETGGIFHKCFVRTKRAIAFAEQLSEIEAYRPEQRFADAMKGLHLYGAKVVIPEEFVVLDLKPVNA